MTAARQLRTRRRRLEAARSFSDVGLWFSGLIDGLATLTGSSVLFPTLMFLLGNAGLSFGQAPLQFTAVDIFVDSGTRPLAAYQLEFKAVGGDVKIVGIEGGEHVAFKEPAFYDPKAMQQERVILAAFSTSKTLPSGRTRIATIHLQVAGPVKPAWTVKLATAADPGGKRIAATVEVKERSRP